MHGRNPYPLLQRMLARTAPPSRPADEGVKYGVPGLPETWEPKAPDFVVDGNGATPELLALLLTGDRAAGSLIATANGVAASEQLQPGAGLTMPEGIRVPSWQDPYAPDSFNRSWVNYWTGRALEASFNALGSVMGVDAVQACTLGKDGKPGECCDPTSDPFPSKPYFYVIPYGKIAEDVARDFGRPDTGWIELRRANADDPDGFLKRDNGWCFWKVWEPKKRLRIPGSWSEADFTAAVLPHLVDGNGKPFKLEEFGGWVNLFRLGIPNRWETPIHMLIECGAQLWSDPSVRPGIDVDHLIAQEIIKRSLVAEQRPVEQPKEKPKIMPLMNLDSASLEQFVATYNPAVIRFHATWCGHCQAFGPIFKAVSQQLSDLAFGEVDVDRNPAASNRYGVKGLPTTIIFKNGQPVASHAGGMQPQNFANWLRSGLT